jgi:hypothetical protein
VASYHRNWSFRVLFAMKGFNKTQPPTIAYQLYNVELKRRMLSDDSELLLGTATIRVPKDLHDPTGQAMTKREVWDAFAQACCYCLINSKAGEEKGVNQIFLFNGNAGVPRFSEATWGGIAAN